MANVSYIDTYGSHNLVLTNSGFSMTTDSSVLAAVAAVPGTTPAANQNLNKTWPILAHLGGLFTSWLVPLVIFLIKKSDPNEAFATDQAREALNFQITVFIAGLVCAILMFVLIGIFLIWILMLVNLVFCIIAAVKCSNGVAYRYPLTIRLIK